MPYPNNNQPPNQPPYPGAPNTHAYPNQMPNQHSGSSIPNPGSQPQPGMQPGQPYPGQGAQGFSSQPYPNQGYPGQPYPSGSPYGQEFNSTAAYGQEYNPYGAPYGMEQPRMEPYSMETVQEHKEKPWYKNPFIYVAYVAGLLTVGLGVALWMFLGPDSGTYTQEDLDRALAESQAIIDSLQETVAEQEDTIAQLEEDLENAQAGSENDENADENNDEENDVLNDPLALGDTLDYNNVSYTLTKATSYTFDGTDYAIIYMTVNNNSDEVIEYNSYDFSFVNANGEEEESTYDYDLFEDLKEEYFTFGDLYPDGTHSGVLAFKTAIETDHEYLLIVSDAEYNQIGSFRFKLSAPETGGEASVTSEASTTSEASSTAHIENEV